MARYHFLLTGLTFWLVALVVPTNAEDYSKPGPFAVGVQRLKVPDATGNHPFTAMVWYPAAGPAPDPKAASLDDVFNAPAAATGPYPLVVVIHGLSGAGGMFFSVGRHFASHGFVVAAADYDTKVLDAGSSWQDQLAVRLLYDRPSDVVRLIKYIDTLSAPGGTLAGFVDTSHIGVWGLSTGGTTAFQAAGAQIDLKALDSWCAENQKDSKAYETCQFVGHERAIATRYGAPDPFAAPMPPIWDKRVAALVATAPGGELHAFGARGLAAVNVPALVMFASDDAVVSPQLNALWAYDGIGSREKALAVLDRGGHTLFMNPFSPHFRDAAALATAFFLAILKGDAAGRAMLMQHAAAMSGVDFRSTLQ